MVDDQRLRLTVIGTGYLGAVHATAMASIGFDVLAIDVDERRISMLDQGTAPFYEPGFEELLSETLTTGRLEFTTDWARVAEHGDVHFLCVGTPQRTDGPGADLSFVQAAVGKLAPLLNRQCVIAGKSTVPVGTAAWITEHIAANSPAHDHIEVVWNPEFLREGFAVQDTLQPDRIVLGSDSPEALATMREVYSSILEQGTPLIETTAATAELVKVAANSFLATKISFINAMADVCEVAGADVTDLAHAIGYDTRIGHRFLGAGLGFGGGCLPKDIRAFKHRADELGVGASLRFLQEVDDLNTRRRRTIAEQAVELCDGDIAGKTVACLGAAFKPDSDDVRDSPALTVASILDRHGATVRVFDPQAHETAQVAAPHLQIVKSLEEAAVDADIVMLLTEWKQFVALDPQAFGEIVANRRIIDARNALDPVAWRAAGWEYQGIGR